MKLWLLALAGNFVILVILESLVKRLFYLLGFLKWKVRLFKFNNFDMALT